MGPFSIAVVLSLAFVFPAVAEALLGVPSVIDGDTIEIHGQRIRLNGIGARRRAPNSA